MLKKISITTIFIVLFFMTGCSSTMNGTMANPAIPVSYQLSNVDKNSKATVYVYRVENTVGFLAPSDKWFYMDYDFNHAEKYDVTHNICIAGTDKYMIKEVEPGLHTFSIINYLNDSINTQTVKLEANKTYYLAFFYTYNVLIGRWPNIEFKTKSDFLENTKGDKEIIVDGTCFFSLAFECKYKYK